MPTINKIQARDGSGNPKGEEYRLTDAGDIEDLSTTDKSSLVAAINEINAKVSALEARIASSGGGT